ncbi:MAG TPA: uridine phosphorylase [Anaerolineaceae bacterium]|nr:uridine phosphorylase [Anaerolineaceae bacterium]
MQTLEAMYHIQLKRGDIGRYVLLPGDPGRTETIAQYFDNPVKVAQNREYTTYTGTLLGEKVAVTSTGIGCPSTAIAIEELIKIGADTFIRVGTSGAMQPHIKSGDVAILTGAIRDEGTTAQYLPIEYPAVADLDVMIALREGARRAGIPFHVGVSHSKDSFYGETEPQRMPMAPYLAQRWDAWVGGGAICSEMEASAIFILAGIYRKRAGGVMLMGGAEEGADHIPLDENARAINPLIDVNRAISVAVEGLKILIEQDRAAGRA